MNGFGILFVCVSFIWVCCIPVDSRPHARSINVTAMRSFDQQIDTALGELRKKAQNAYTIYGNHRGFYGSSIIDLSRFFVDSPPPAKKWNCLKRSKRFNKCIRTFKAFVGPLNFVVEDERQQHIETGDSQTLTAILELRNSIESTYRTIEKMVNQSNIVLDTSLKIVKLKTLDTEVENQYRQLDNGNWPPTHPSPTELRNYAILESLLGLLVMDHLENTCKVIPRSAVTASSAPCQTASI